ncbi:MAG TPA: hypothetical protein VJU61_01575 [Polyangiaceae bacterium]|nr:hypothetical protein [Polyangiaceae bacterium]
MSHTARASSTYRAAHAARCGDGALQRDAGEECDGGNRTNNDGCNVSCDWELLL